MERLFIEYPKCSTCRKAKKYLEEHQVTFEDRHIVENNPTAEELQEWIRRSGLPVKRFFNTSGKMYKEMEKLSVPEIRYYTLEEIPVREYTIGEGLEQLDRNNLNYILRGLLQYVDSPDEKNIPVAALTMLTRKYSASRSHKKGTLKNQALFSTPTYTYKELSDKCNVLLGQLISIMKLCDDFTEPI